MPFWEVGPPLSTPLGTPDADALAGLQFLRQCIQHASFGLKFIEPQTLEVFDADAGALTKAVLEELPRVLP